MQRPVLASRPQGRHFAYKFSLIRRENPDATVVVFIPGGPGQTSMQMGLSYPDEFAVLRTDPRGVGCNQAEFPADSLTSEEIARDILAAVREIKPKRYILHGISYGTVVATMAAALAAEEKVPAPVAVVLEGTMGRVFAENEYIEGYLKNWKSLKATLPENISAQFKGPIFPLGYSSKEWAAWMSGMLIYGITPLGDDLLQENLLRLAPPADENKTASLAAQLRRARIVPSAEKTRLYREIICRELVPDVRDVKYDFDFSDGNLVATKERLCAGIPVSRPFDSAKYQIKVPVYYFSGALDPATPAPQARYHFENQKGSKTLLSIANGGHQALSANLMDCAGKIWLAIDSGQTGRISQALSGCAQKNQITTEIQQSLNLRPEIFADFEKLYQPALKRLGKNLKVSVKESDNSEEASADSDGTNLQVVVSSGLLRSPRLSDDGLRFTLCHEMGHLLGGAPRRNVPFEWDGPTAPDGLSFMSSEGQADYYASKICFRELVKGQNHVEILKLQPVSSFLKSQCEISWASGSEGALICQRAAMGGNNMLQLTRAFSISFETPSEDMVSQTIRNSYPPRQCRLDTALAGARCRDRRELVMDFNRPELNSCEDIQAARPACWYK